VIDKYLVKSNILPERELELDAIQFVIDQINPKNVVRPDEVHIEGGDVMLWNDYIFIGTYKGVIIKIILQLGQILKEFSL
jgi:arginine deiminase